MKMSYLWKQTILLNLMLKMSDYAVGGKDFHKYECESSLKQNPMANYKLIIIFIF